MVEKFIDQYGHRAKLARENGKETAELINDIIDIVDGYISSK